jgi:hypothetical protein
LTELHSNNEPQLPEVMMGLISLEKLSLAGENHHKIGATDFIFE